MNKQYLILAALVITMACQTKKQETELTEEKDTTAQVATPSFLPQLTEQRKSEGWKLLFDGQTTNGWRFFKDKPNDSWEVVDGVLHCKPFVDGKDNKRSDIMTTEEFENFELAFDWKISPQGNSGVMFHVTEEYDQPYFSGPEYQVMDDEGYPGDPTPDQLTGGNYAMQAPTNAKPNAIGEWNSSRLVVNGNHVEHWLNGTKTVEYELNSADWEKRKAAGKWKDEKGYGAAKKGHIDLQDHNHEVWFKNIMIKTL